MRPGESLRDWDGTDTSLPGLDVLVFLASLSARLVSLVRVSGSLPRPDYSA